MLILLFVDAVSLLGGIFAAAYLSGGGGRLGEVSGALPVVLAVGLALFAAHDLYDRAQSRRNPGALVGAVLWWAGLLAIGSVVYDESGFILGEVLLAAVVALVIDGGLRLLYEQGIEWVYRRGLGLIPRW